MQCYHIAEFMVLLVLMIRLFYYLGINKKITKTNLELLLYISLLFGDSLVFICFGKYEIVTVIFDSILPALIIIPILSRRFHFSNPTQIFAMILFPSFNFIVNNSTWNYFLLLLCIVFLISTAIKLATGPNLSRRKTPLYVVFCLDLIIIAIFQQISTLQIKWIDSTYAIHLDTGLFIAYFLILILIHVYIRRYFFT
jgi:hypothetical protein